MQGRHRNCSGLAAARLPAGIYLRVVETRTAEAILVKAFAVPGPGAAKMVAQMTHAESAGSRSKANSSSKAKASAAEAADVTAEATDMTAEAAHMATATHMATPAASCLRIGRKQTAGQQSARQNYHRSSHHRIVLSVQLYLRCVGTAR